MRSENFFDAYPGDKVPIFGLTKRFFQSFIIDTSLLDACSRGDSDLVYKLIPHGIDLYYRDARGYTALHIALQNGEARIVQYLLDAGTSLHLSLLLPPFAPLEMICALGQILWLSCFIYGLYSPISWIIFSSQAATRNFWIAITLLIGHTVLAILSWILYAWKLSSSDHPSFFTVAMEFEGSTEDMLVMLLDAGFEPTAYEAILLWRHAACRGYTSVAQRFLLEEWPVDFKIPEVQIKVSDEGPGDIYDTTALMHACESGHRDLFHLLLANGANVRFRDTLKQFPLYLAAQARYCTYASDAKDYEEIFDALLRTDAQKDRNAIIPGEQDWKWEVLSPLGIAVQSQQPGPVRMLLQAGADPNLGNSLGQTPLHVACTTLSASDDDHVEIIDLLLRHGAKVDAVTNHGWTPLGRVANLGVSSRACFRLLDAGAMVDIGGGKLDTALHAAARHDVSGELILRALIARSGDVNNMNGMYGTVLLAAMDRPRGGPEHDKALLSIVNLLIQHGVDINLTPSECRKSAIELAAEYGHAMVMDRLMRQGAKVNSEFSIIDIGSMKFRNSSLSTVSIYKPQIFNLLLFKGAPVESDCFLNDKSILEEACSGEGPLALETVKILLSHGADVNRRGPLGVTPLHRACFGLKQDVVSLLIDSGADCTAHCESYGVPLHSLCAGIVKQFSSPERKAAYNCILNILIDGNGLKLDAMDGDGASPLHKLAASTAESRYPADGSEKLVLTAMNQLLDLAQPEESRYIRTPDSSGRTLIHIAASAGDGEMLELLLNRSITDDVSQESLNSLRDNKGHTPLHCAIEKEHIDACKLLLRSATSDQALTPQVTEELRQFAAKHDNAHLVRIIRELSPGSPHGSPRDEYPSVREPLPRQKLLHLNGFTVTYAAVVIGITIRYLWPQN